nr:MAG TPA: hypothetical protein [Caudoviricetes sp.]
MSASNIPMGSEYDKNAIWEQVENQAVERDYEVMETITRKVTLSTTDYVTEEDWDEEFGKCVSADTYDTDWAGEYSNQEYTVLELIDKLKVYVEEDIKNTSPNTGKGRELQRLLSACNGWEQVELNVEEE